MKCDIIIPVWDQLEFTKSCIDSLIKNTNYPYRLILVDNGSEEETRVYLEGLRKDNPSGITLIRNEDNLGFIRAVNQGLKESSAPYICILNNDTIPAAGWLERMVEFAEAHKDAGLINPQCGGHEGTSIEKHAGDLRKFKGQYMEMNQCQGFCLLLKRSLVDEIGLLDESYGIGGYDDTDYSMRAHLAGYRCVSIRDSYVYHRLHSSFNKSGDREEWVKRNRRIYYDKWGKHLRVGLAVSSDKPDNGAISKVVMFAYGLAREWSWVHIWINCKAGKGQVRQKIEAVLAENGLPPHQNIRIDSFNIPSFVFNMTIAGKLLERLRKRMRDKRFDAVVLFDEGHRWPVSTAAKVVNAGILKVDLNERGIDWQKKGKETALLIKTKRERDGRGTV